MNRYIVTFTNRFDPRWKTKRTVTERNEKDAETSAANQVAMCTGEPAGNWEIEVRVAKWLPN